MGRPQFDKKLTPHFFTQTGNGGKRPYRACMRVGSLGVDWVVLGCYSTYAKAKQRVERAEREHGGMQP